MENNKRLFWIDNLKGLMILLVVISHCLFLSYYDPQTKYVCDTYHYFFLSFFSYVFFGVSGYLFELRKKGNASVYSLIRREIQLIFPMMIISVVDVLLFSGCKLNSFPYTDGNVLFNVVRFSSLKEFIMLVIRVAYSYWFMWIIAAIYFVHFILEHILSNVWITIITIGVYVCAIVCNQPVLGKLIISYWGFLIGILVRKKEGNVQFSKRCFMFSTIFYLVYSVTVYNILGFDTISNALIKMPMAVSSTFAFMFCFRKIFNRKNILFSIMGKESLSIYLIHWELFLWLGNGIALRLNWSGWIGICLGLGLSILCIIISILAVKILDYIPIARYAFHQSQLLDRITKGKII